MTAWGIDISNHQKGANLAKAKAAGASFVFAKATEGLTYVDSEYTDFRSAAAAAGLPLGAYHFARPQAGRTGEDEAKHFLSVHRQAPGDLPPVLDLEDTKTSSGATIAFALEWLLTVQKATGVRPIVYTYSGFAQQHLGGGNALAAYPLWLANYRSTPPPAPAPWSAWAVWQHTSSATVPGIPGACDRNIAAPTFPPATTTTEDDMPTPAELWGYKAPGETKDAYEYLRNAIADKAADLAVQRLLASDTIPAPVKQDGNPTWTVGASLEWTGKGVVALQATVATLQSAVTALAEAKGADADAITKAVVDKIAALTINLDPQES